MGKSPNHFKKEEKMKILKSSVILAIAFITMLLNGCEDNEADAPNINPETGTLSGAITFVGTWPDSGSVLLTLDVQFPPMGPPAGSKTIESNQLENDVYEYTLDNLSFGEYAALTVTYWPSGYSPGSSNYSLIASYLDPISLTTENPNTIIDLTATF